MTILNQIARIRSKVVFRQLHFNDCLTPKEIKQFENMFNISLPEDFKYFLLEIGDGGAGPPFYGMNRLNDMISRDSAIPFRPDIPFPLSQEWTWESETKDWWQDPSQIVQHIHCHGQLLVGTEGCGEYWSLIVSGDQYGYMWNISDVGAGPFVQKQSFTDWYEAWLDSLDKKAAL